MKRSLLIWGALVVVALCFVGCCYYNTTHCHRGCGKSDCPTCSQQNADDGDEETVTIEAVELIPVNAPAQDNAPATNAPAQHNHPAPAANAPASGN
jgi:hypothetical protein